MTATWPASDAALPASCAQSTLVTMEGWVRCMVFSRPKDVAHVQALYAADDAGGIAQVTIEVGSPPPALKRPHAVFLQMSVV
jgi:hypothetical protein